MASLPTFGIGPSDSQMAIRAVFCAVNLSVLAAMVFGMPEQAKAQGGGNANAVGASIEGAVRSSGTPSGPPSGTRSGPPQGYGSSSGPPSGTPSGPPEGYGSPEGSEGMYDTSGEYGGYGDNSGGYGYGGQSGTTAAARAQVWMSAGTQQVARALAGFFDQSSAVPELRIDRLSLWEQASLAYFLGNQRKALSLYHAHIIADGNAADSARKDIRFSRLLKRPVWLVRFGVSVHPRVPDQFLDDPEPIREGMQIAAGRGRAVSSEDYGSGESSSPEFSGPPESYDSGSGDSSMDPRGEYGAVPALQVVTTLGGPATEEAAKKLDKNLGIVAEVVKTRFAALQGAGKFGTALNSMEAAGQKFAAQSSDAASAVPTGLPMWIPGVDFVGEGPFNEMLAVAKTNQIDFLLHFDVIVKENRIGPPSYTTRCKLLNVETGETVGISKAIDKYEIAGKKTGIRESIEEQVANLFEIMEKKVAVEPMPTLQPQQAISRIDSLLASSKPGSLRDLAEISMYRSQELISTELVDKAFFFAGGEDALLLIHDEEAKRYEKANERLQLELDGIASK